MEGIIFKSDKVTGIFFFIYKNNQRRGAYNKTKSIVKGIIWSQWDSRNVMFMKKGGRETESSSEKQKEYLPEFLVQCHDWVETTDPLMCSET
jgi:hypothetical protein